MTFHDTLWLIGSAALPSLLVSWLVGFPIRQMAPSWDLVDRPGDAHKKHAAPTPLGGGLAIWLGVMVTFAVGQIGLWWLAYPLTDVTASAPQSSTHLPDLLLKHLSGLREKAPDLWLLLAGGTILMAVGLIDDRYRLGWRIRLALQLLVAAAGVFMFEHWRLTVFIDLPFFTGFLSVIWIVGVVNSFNMLDNMDGLSAGVGAIVSVMLAAALLVAPQPGGGEPQLFVAGFLFVLAGSLSGFLWHNRPPARLFMGDAGSYFVGFCIAVATIQSTFAGYSSSSRHTILAPLCVMAVPLYDMVTVIWIRLQEGRSPFQGDRRHFSHRLLDLGFSRPLAVLTIYLATTICGLAALVLHQVNGFGAVLIVVLVASVLGLIGILETIARRKVLSSNDSAEDEKENCSR